MVAPTSKRFSRAAREREAVASGSYPWSNEPAADPWTRAERKLFRDAFAAAPTGIAVLDLQGRLVRVNARVPEMTGYAVEELLGRHIETLVDGRPDGRDRDALCSLIAGDQETHEREARYERKDGRPLWVSVKLGLVCDDAGEALCVIAHLFDVTEQRAADRALRDVTERFGAAFENAPIGMALIAVDGRPLQVNRALVDMTGFSSGQLLEKTITELVHADDLQPADFADIEALLAGESDTWRADKRFHDARGHQLWVSVSASIVRGDSGKPAYAIAQVQDISEGRRLLDRLAHLANHDRLTGLANRGSFEQEI
jgi:PAS domain S-box-containing protein